MPDSIPVRDCFWYRLALNLTQVEVAQQARICTRSYANIETGRTNPSTATLHRLAEVFKVSPARLRGEE